MLLYIRDTFRTNATEGQLLTEEEAPVEDAALAEAAVQALFQHGNLRCASKTALAGRPRLPLAAPLLLHALYRLAEGAEALLAVGTTRSCRGQRPSAEWARGRWGCSCERCSGRWCRSGWWSWCRPAACPASCAGCAPATSLGCFSEGRGN